MDGNLNTAKILAHMADAPAAALCANLNNVEFGVQTYLPSVGQLSLMQENRTAINALLRAANAEGCSYDLLPYQNTSESWVRPNNDGEYWLSSTRSAFGRSWAVTYEGRIKDGVRLSKYSVRAVSAFRFVWLPPFSFFPL